MNWELFAGIATVVLSILGSLGFVVKFKGKLSKAGILAKETADVISKVNEVLDDNKLTIEEVQSLQKELEEVKVAWKALFEKEVII